MTQPSTVLSIQSFSLDEIFPHQEVLMLKIDVQGGEQSVLNGAKKLIAEGRVKYCSGISKVCR